MALLIAVLGIGALIVGGMLLRNAGLLSMPSTERKRATHESRSTDVVRASATPSASSPGSVGSLDERQTLTSTASNMIPPAPTRYVTDKAAVITPEMAVRLETRLADFEKETSNQFLVYTQATIPGGTTLEEYTVALTQAWKAGQTRRNGMILFVFPGSRKVRLEVGYGLEGAMPDAVARRVLDEQVVPRFRTGDYDGGIFAGVSAAIAATRGDYKGTAAGRAESGSTADTGAPGPSGATGDEVKAAPKLSAALGRRPEAPRDGVARKLAAAPADAESSEPPQDSSSAVLAEREPMRVGGEVTEPVETFRVRPVYPEAARKAHMQGVVTLEAIITKDGDVESVRVLRGLNPLLDNAAIRAVSQWKYQPAAFEGRPVPVYLTVTVTFSL